MKYNKKIPWIYILSLAFIAISCTQENATSPTRKTINDAVFASGYIEQENNYTVSAKVEGIILELPVREGDSVAENDLIAVIENDVQSHQLKDALVVHNDALSNTSADSPQLQHLKMQIQQAQQQLTFDEDKYVTYKELWENKSVSKLDFEKAKLQYNSSQSHLLSLQENYREVMNSLELNAQRSLVQVRTQEILLKDYKLITEESGTVINVFKKQGELARRGEAIARIGRGVYIIRLLVAEEDINKIDLGLPVAINMNTYPSEVFQASITKIHPGFDENEQSYVVEARFEELPEKIFSGTQLQANIKTGSRKNVLVIPTDYISKGNQVKLKNGKERQIVIGSKNSEWTEVVSGISEKDSILKP